MGSDDMYTELWKACAGPLVDVPRTGERVYYFPQGHIEQVFLSKPLIWCYGVLFYFIFKKKISMVVYWLLFL